MYVRKIVFGSLIAVVLLAGCEKTKRKTVVITDPKLTEENSQLKKERDELAEKLAISSDPKMKEKLVKLESDLSLRDAEIKTKDALIAAKEKELEEAKKGHDAEEVARLQKELDTLRSEKVALEAEHKSVLAGKEALLDAAERDRTRLEKLLDYSFKNGVQSRDQLEAALKVDVTEAEGRVNLLTQNRAGLKADIAKGYEQILKLQAAKAPTVDDMLADKKALEALSSRTEEQVKKLETLTEYFDLNELLDERTKARLPLATDQEKLETDRDTIAAELASATMEEARILDEIVKLSETEGTQPSARMKELIAERNARLSEISAIESKKTENSTALEEISKKVDTIDGEIKGLKDIMDELYASYQGTPAGDTLKEAETEQNRLLAAYKENGKDLESARTSLEEARDLHDYVAQKSKPEEPETVSEI